MEYCIRKRPREAFVEELRKREDHDVRLGKFFAEKQYLGIVLFDKTSNEAVWFNGLEFDQELAISEVHWDGVGDPTDKDVFEMIQRVFEDFDLIVNNFELGISEKIGNLLPDIEIFATQYLRCLQEQQTEI